RAGVVGSAGVAAVGGGRGGPVLGAPGGAGPGRGGVGGDAVIPGAAAGGKGGRPGVRAAGTRVVPPLKGQPAVGLAASPASTQAYARWLHFGHGGDAVGEPASSMRQLAAKSASIRPRR